MKFPGIINAATLTLTALQLFNSIQLDLVSSPQSRQEHTHNRKENKGEISVSAGLKPVSVAFRALPQDTNVNCAVFKTHEAKLQ